MMQEATKNEVAVEPGAKPKDATEVAIGASEDDVTSNTREKIRPCGCNPIIIVLMLLPLGAIAVAAWFVWRYAGRSPDTIIYTPNPNPFQTPPPTTLYDPPTIQNCEDIANGIALDGQSAMEIWTFIVAIDIHVNSNLEEAIPVITADVAQFVQQSVITSMAGCNDVFTKPPELAHISEMRYYPYDPYSVASGSVNVTHELKESCYATDQGPCFRARAKLDLYMKGEARAMAVWIGEVFEEEFRKSDRGGMVVTSIEPLASTLYDPPTAQDCMDLANGVALDTQAAMEIQSYGLAIDVFSISAEEQQAVMAELDDVIQQSIITTLAGCGDSSLNAEDYVVASGFANVTHKQNVSCWIDEPSCFRVNVELDLYMKDSQYYAITAWIWKVFVETLPSEKWMPRDIWEIKA